MYNHANRPTLAIASHLFVLTIDSRGINRIEGIICSDTMVPVDGDGGVEGGIALRVDIRIDGTHAIKAGGFQRLAVGRLFAVVSRTCLLIDKIGWLLAKASAPTSDGSRITATAAWIAEVLEGPIAIAADTTVVLVGIGNVGNKIRGKSKIWGAGRSLSDLGVMRSGRR